jgi:hypothetical protein
MPSNPNIALSVKAPQFRGPLDTFARAQQIAANNMAMQKAQREAAAVNAMQTYLKGGGKLETAADIQTAAQAGVDPSVAQKIAEQNLNLGKFGVEQKKIATERLFNRLGAVARAGELGSDAEWVNWLNDYSQLGDEEFREAGAFLNMTKGRYDPSVVKSLMAGAPEYFKKTTPQAQAEIIQNEAGDFFEGRTGGVTPGGAYRLEEYEQTPQPPVKKEVETGEPFNIRDGGMGGPYTNDTADILDGIVSVQNDRDYQDALALVERANPDMVAALRRAMPRFDPTRIKGIRAAFSSAFGGAPDQPGLVTGERGGVADIPMAEGGRGGPLEGYTSTGRQLRGKSPMQSPMPGSAIVPIQRVRQEAAAQRRTPGETYQEQRSQEQAKSDVAFLDAYESSKSDAQNILSVIDQMIGDLNIKDGKIVQGKRPPHPGFEGVIGAGVPGVRFIPGTQAADFDAFMEQVQGGAFLKAYNALRGTGQITEKEGEKATTALSRMKRSQSEAGFIKAAREFEGVVRSAVQRADARAARLRGGTPTSKRNIDALLKKYGD